MLWSEPAYRIHISLSTMKVLTSLKLGYHMETRKAQVRPHVFIDGAGLQVGTGS